MAQKHQIRQEQPLFRESSQLPPQYRTLYDEIDPRDIYCITELGTSVHGIRRVPFDAPAEQLQKFVSGAGIPHQLTMRTLTGADVRSFLAGLARAHGAVVPYMMHNDPKVPNDKP